MIASLKYILTFIPNIHLEWMFWRNPVSHKMSLFEKIKNPQRKAGPGVQPSTSSFIESIFLYRTELNIVLY